MKKPTREWVERSKSVLAQSHTGTNSKRWTSYIDGVYPSHIERGEGCYLIDKWGNRYLDMICGLGTNLLGYNHPKCLEAVERAKALGGPSFSLPHSIEVQVAEKIRERIPCAERIRFLKNGDDATTAAIRIARATGYNEVYSEGYHGRSDIWTSLTPPAFGVVEAFHIHTDERNEEEVSICEPVSLDIRPNRKEHLEVLRKKSKVLIFDEIITGFRVPKWTVANMWDIKPDIICLGKAIANGFPLSVVAGREEVMNCGEYFISSTFSGEIMSLFVADAVIDQLSKENLNDLMFYGMRMQNKFNEVAAPIGAKLEGYGSRAMLNCDEPGTQLLMQEMCKMGVLLGKAWFFSFSHLENNVEEYFMNLLSDCVYRIRLGSVRLEGKPAVQTFKR